MQYIQYQKHRLKANKLADNSVFHRFAAVIELCTLLDFVSNVNILVLQCCDRYVPIFDITMEYVE